MPRISFLIAKDQREGIDDAKARRWKRIATARFVKSGPPMEDVRVVTSPKDIDRAPEGSKLYPCASYEKRDDKKLWEAQIKHKKLVWA